MIMKIKMLCFGINIWEYTPGGIYLCVIDKSKINNTGWASKNNRAKENGVFEEKRTSGLWNKNIFFSSRSRKIDVVVF